MKSFLQSSGSADSSSEQRDNTILEKSPFPSFHETRKDFSIPAAFTGRITFMKKAFVKIHINVNLMPFHYVRANQQERTLR